MLDELRVTNLGLIAQAHLEPGPGLVVVTGETGAGKTLLLGALRLLLGGTTRQDQVGPAGPAVEVEGRFVWKDGELAAARKVGEGRSRAYLNGSMVPARKLAESTAGMVEIVGQHDHISMAGTQGVRRLIDNAMDAEGRDAKDGYQTAFEALRELRRAQEAIGGDRRALERELDMARFQADEISAAGFEEGDDESLASLANRLRNAETISEGLAAAAEALDDDSGAVGRLSQAVGELSRLARLDAAFDDLAAEARDVLNALDELGSGISSAASGMDRDPSSLADVEERLALLGGLRRKYGDSLVEVLRFGEAAAERAFELTSMLERADGLAGEITKAEAVVDEAGARLAGARKLTADRLATAAVGHLKELGFSAPVVAMTVEPAAPGPEGADTVRLLFSSDESLPPGPVARVASGGELSRLVLALRLAAGVADADVVAFDEIDAGIGGATALAMGEKLASLAAGRQVLCVTHLPQVAAYADTHYVVHRTGAVTGVGLVAGEDRLEELSRMLSGLPESLKGRQHAAELLDRAAAFRAGSSEPRGPAGTLPAS
jgi:DNA repair protein RecN (Recombination protein N)